MKIFVLGAVLCLSIQHGFARYTPEIKNYEAPNSQLEHAVGKRNIEYVVYAALSGDAVEAPLDVLPGCRPMLNYQFRRRHIGERSSEEHQQKHRPHRNDHSFEYYDLL